MLGSQQVWCVDGDDVRKVPHGDVLKWFHVPVTQKDVWQVMDDVITRHTAREHLARPVIVERDCGDANFLTQVADLYKNGGTVIGTEVKNRLFVEASQRTWKGGMNTRLFLQDGIKKAVREATDQRKCDVVCFEGPLMHLQNPQYVVMDMTEAINPEGV
ncbi:MAG: hypothetical protein KC736_02275 [Candidatus Moranbacteria bacterium]|nr:hypothetical protein [Candidatus Moranbacteria bacterium]